MPMLPSAGRDDITIEMMTKFPNSQMLVEKPSHSNAEDAKAFK